NPTHPSTDTLLTYTTLFRSDSNFTHKINRNNGDGTFTDISDSTGINAMTMTGIENCTYDFNNDGYADIASNGNILLNNGDLTFTDRKSTRLNSSHVKI